jgi:hypothetical protein
MTTTSDAAPTKQPHIDLALYDQRLGSLLWSAMGSPSEVLLAVMTGAITKDLPKAEVRTWLSRRVARSSSGSRDARTEGAVASIASDRQRSNLSNERLRSIGDLVGSSYTWTRLWDKAEGYVLSPTSESSVASSVVRTLYARLLLPLPHGDDLGYKRNLNTRVALAAMVTVMVRSGRDWKSVVFTQPRLALLVGWSITTANVNLRVLCELGILKRIRSWGVYRVVALSKDEQDRIRDYEDSINSFLGDEPDALAATIRSVTHPAWGYSSAVQHAHWAKLLLDIAGVPVATWKLRPAIERELAGGLRKEYLLEATAARYLDRILDEIADRGPTESSARAACVAAEANWAAAAALNKTRVSGLRAEKFRSFRQQEMDRATRPPSGPQRASRRRSDDDEDDTSVVSSPAQQSAVGFDATPAHSDLVKGILRGGPIPRPSHLGVDEAEQTRLYIGTRIWAQDQRRLILGSKDLEQVDFQQAGDELTGLLTAAQYGRKTCASIVRFILEGIRLPGRERADICAC